MKRLLCGFLIASSLINAMQPSTYATDNAIKKIDELTDKKPVIQTTVKDKPTKTPFTSSAPSETADEMQKKNALAISLVKEGVKFLTSQSIEKTCYEFTHTNKFVRGELSLFLIDKDGRYIADNDDPTVLWQNINDKSDNNSLTIKKLVDIVQTGNGWTHYEWKHATRVIYVELVRKNNQDFFVGTGYYSFSQEDQVINLVKRAVALFEEKKALGLPAADAFGDMSYPGGALTLGNLYLFAYDFEGVTMAHGDDPSSIGINKIDRVDDNGVPLYLNLILQAKALPNGGWTEYVYKGAPKKSYGEKVTGADGKEYQIGSGYYPTANRKAAITLVDRGYEALKTLGLSKAVSDFTGSGDQFRFGDLYLFVYDMKGQCLAHGKIPSLVGRNFYHAKDAQGNFYIQSMIKRATPEGAWVNIQGQNNQIESAYIRKVNLGTGQYIIGCGIYPASKEENMILLTKSASSFFSVTNNAEAFSIIANPNRQFTKGDLNVFIFDTEGFCFIHGNNLSAIWQNFMKTTDDNGRPFVKTIIESALTNPSQIRYRINGAIKESYVESIKKDGKFYIIGSSRYL